MSGIAKSIPSTNRLLLHPSIEQYMSLLALMIPQYESAGLSVFYDTARQRLSLVHSSLKSSESNPALIPLLSTSLEEHTDLLKSYLDTGPGCLLDSVLVGVVLL
jgi:hypothetical protein